MRDAVWEVWSPERLKRLGHEKPGRKETTKNQIAA